MIKISQDRIEAVIALHKSGLGMSKICKQLKIGKNTLRKIYVEYVLEKYTDRKYKIDESFLNYIDNEAKAYFLGWLWTDGSVSGRDNCIAFQLQSNDKAVLELFSNWFYGQNLVKTYQRETFKNGDYVSLQLYSKRLKERVIELGCVPNKTFVIQYPEINNSLHRHFIRGVLEGDGHISKAYNCNISITIVSASLIFLEQLKEVIKSNLNVNVEVYDRVSIKSLKVSGIADTNKFLNWVYQDSSCVLSRKYQRYLDIKNRVVEPYFKLHKDVDLIKELYENGEGCRKIAKRFDVSREAVTTAVKQIGIHNSEKKLHKIICAKIEKKCKKCSQIKSIVEFRKRIKNERISYESSCLLCEKEYNKENCSKKYHENIERRKQYRLKNLNKLREQNREYQRRKRSEKLLLNK